MAVLMALEYFGMSVSTPVSGVTILISADIRVALKEQTKSTLEYLAISTKFKWLKHKLLAVVRDSDVKICIQVSIFWF